MTARFSTTYSSTRCTMAAACSSARISPILDTAMILAVSICVVRLLLAAAAITPALFKRIPGLR